jgi:acyl-CoA synthetase (AMP-forming)/AMP-acid ligase II
MKADKLGDVLADAGAKAVIADHALHGTIEEARRTAASVQTHVEVGGGELTLDELAASAPSPTPHLDIDLAALIYTSGSTGRPKGVTLLHRNMTFAARSLAEYLEMRQDDRVLCVLPMSFDVGLYQLFLTARVGASLVLERGFTFPGRLVSLLQEERITGLPGVPTLFGVLLGLRGIAEHGLPDLRFLTNTGAALSRATIAGLRGAFPQARIYSMYGLTECKRVSYLPPHLIDERPESVGVPIPGTEVWVADEDGNEVPRGEVGELIVRGAHVMVGYWNAPEQTAEKLMPGRWPWERALRTGDLFRQDADGFLTFVGRRDDMIKSRGEKIPPKEIEEVLYAVEGVRDAGVVGIPDELLGTAVHAHVALYEGSDLDERALRRACAQRLEDYMVPGRIFVHAELPRNTSGKIDKLRLTELSKAEVAQV